MRNYIYKVIIAVIALIIVFEFTIGRKFNQIDEISKNFLTKEGRKEMINSIKKEMEKATKKENFSTSFVSNFEKELRVNTFFRLREPEILKSLKGKGLISKNDSPQEVFLALRKLRNDW